MTVAIRTPHRAAGGAAAVATATAGVKLRPPAAPVPLLRRERLLSVLDAARDKRLTTIVAGAGFGKSTLLAAWAADINCAWYSASPDDASLAAFARGVADALRLRAPALPADAAAAVSATAGPGAQQDDPTRARGFVATICDALQSTLRRDLVLVLEDVHEIDGAPGAMHVVEALCRQAPERLHLVVTTRSELPFPIERLRGQGHVLELSGAELAFDIDETSELLTTLAGVEHAGAAAELHAATGGWPAAVRLAVEALRGVAPRERTAAFERIRRPGGPLLAYLAAEVFANEPPHVEELVRTVAPLERFSADLCEALGATRAHEVLQSLARRGLAVELRGHATGWFTLGPPVRQFALSRAADGDTRRIRLLAARWFEQQGEPEEALRCVAAAGEPTELARILEAGGPALVASGSGNAALEAYGLLPAALRSPTIEELAGDALQVRGDWDEALRCYARAAGDADRPSPGLARRMGVLHHLTGRIEEAIAAYEQVREEGEPRDLALLLAWRGSAHWLRRDAEACRRDATRAFAIASEAEDPRSLAAAHTLLAMLAALDGDRGANDAHYLRALDYAQQAGDVLQVIRIRTNRGSRHVEEGAYEEAIAELDLALSLADLAGFASFRALALSNRGEALARLGRFEEAVADLEASKELFQRLGSRMVAYPLGRLGDVYQTRGETALARAVFGEAITQAEIASDVQGLVPALCGLARVVMADEPEEAERLVERALSFDPGIESPQVLLTAGWVALSRGRRDDTLEHAASATTEAGARRDRHALAESLELRALATSDRARAVRWLEEAAGIWRDVGNPADQARVELEAALLTGNSVAARAAEGRLRAIGARGYRSAVSLLSPREDMAPIAVQSLGRFRVFRAGEPVPLAAWQSRKARDLFKMLVGRRGRSTPRDVLMEALWPGQSPARLGNRLSVLLSTVRSVLDPDKRYDPDHFVVADRNAVWLDAEHLSLDVAEFLAAANEAFESRRTGEASAHDRLLAAEALYAGDFLEEDAYEDWAIGVREESRAVYMQLARVLADDALRTGDTDAATRYHLRILERDPYDERAHLGLVTTLVATGRHGEARRCFRVYCARMDEIGVESAPFPTSTRNEP